MLEFLNWLFLISLTGGFFTGKYLSGSKGGNGKLKSLMLPFIKNYRIHLHHWFISLLILISLLRLGFYHALIYGFNLGLIFQGLTYSDWYKLIRKSKKK